MTTADDIMAAISSGGMSMDRLRSTSHSYSEPRGQPKSKGVNRSYAKRKIKEVINSRPDFKQYLQEHNVEGKFIKAFADSCGNEHQMVIEGKVESIQRSSYPICAAFT